MKNKLYNTKQMYAYFAFKLFWHDPKWPLIEREMYKTLKSASPAHL